MRYVGGSSREQAFSGWTVLDVGRLGGRVGIGRRRGGVSDGWVDGVNTGS